MVSLSRTCVIAFGIITALVLASLVIIHTSHISNTPTSFGGTWKSPKIRAVIETFMKPPELINFSCSYWRSSLIHNVRPVFRVLSPYVLSNLTSFLKGVTGLSGFTYVATITSKGVNYSILEVVTPGNSLSTLYYVSWKFISNKEVKILNYGKVRLKEVTSNLNSTKLLPCGAIGCCHDVVPKYLRYLRGSFKVLRFVKVPKPLNNIYVVLMHYRVIIGYGDKVLMNSSIVSKFFIDYGNKVLKIEGPIITSYYDKRNISIDVIKHLSNLSLGTSYLRVKVFLRGIMLSTHKVIEVPIDFYVDPLLGIAYPVEAGAYRVVQVKIGIS